MVTSIRKQLQPLSSQSLLQLSNDGLSTLLIRCILKISLSLYIYIYRNNRLSRILLNHITSSLLLTNVLKKWGWWLMCVCVNGNYFFFFSFSWLYIYFNWILLCNNFMSDSLKLWMRDKIKQNENRDIKYGKKSLLISNSWTMWVLIRVFNFCIHFDFFSFWNFYCGSWVYFIYLLVYIFEK
jgi:hypothetical protein